MSMQETTEATTPDYIAPSPAAAEAPGVGGAWRDALSREELDELLTVRNWRGALTIATNWAGIAATFALVAWAPGPWWKAVACVAALFLLASRQLGMAVVMHEASHRTLFRNRRLNDWAGNWLAAYPVWADLEPYRPYHLKHHAYTGTERDPDLGLVRPFPITRASLWRKIWRDISGQTGWKQFVAVAKRDLGIATKRTQRDLGFNKGKVSDVGWRKLVPVVTTNAILLGVLWLCGHPWLYLLWVISWFTTYRLVTRIRSIAEHAIVLDKLDPLRNTRTVRAGPWERLFIAPNRVNYHIEHHLLMTVPLYNLPKMHRLLTERGVFDHALISPDYWSVLRDASAAASS